jgi:hypothetical protein
MAAAKKIIEEITCRNNVENSNGMAAILGNKQQNSNKINNGNEEMAKLLISA